jgi:hypothetical protein
MTLKETIFYINNKYNIKDLTTLTQAEVQKIITFAFEKGADQIKEENYLKPLPKKFTISDIQSGKS